MGFLCFWTYFGAGFGASLMRFFKFVGLVGVFCTRHMPTYIVRLCEFWSTVWVETHRLGTRIRKAEPALSLGQIWLTAQQPSDKLRAWRKQYQRSWLVGCNVNRAFWKFCMSDSKIACGACGLQEWGGANGCQSFGVCAWGSTNNGLEHTEVLA